MIEKLLLHNWQGKLVSFVVAFAVWHLIHGNVSEPTDKYDPNRYPVPGTGPAPVKAETVEPGLPVTPILDVPIP